MSKYSGSGPSREITNGIWGMCVLLGRADNRPVGGRVFSPEGATRKLPRALALGPPTIHSRGVRTPKGRYRGRVSPLRGSGRPWCFEPTRGCLPGLMYNAASGCKLQRPYLVYV